MSFKSKLEKIVDGFNGIKKATPVILGIGASALIAPSQAEAAQAKGYIGHSHSNGNNIVLAQGEVFFPLIQDNQGIYLDAFHVKGSVRHDVNLDETAGLYDVSWNHRFWDGVPSTWGTMGVRNDVYGSEENNAHGYAGLSLIFPSGPWLASVSGEFIFDDERVGGGLEIGVSYHDGTVSGKVGIGTHYTGRSESDLITNGNLSLGINVGELTDSEVLKYLQPTIRYEHDFDTGKGEIFLGNEWYF